MRANFVLSGVWAGIRRNMTMTIALVLSTSIALAFVGAAYLASVEISQFKRDYEGSLNVSVFLCAKVHKPPCTAKTTVGETDALRSALDKDPRVAAAPYVSEQEQYRRAIKVEPEDVAAQAKVGDLPASFTVKLKDIQKDFDSFASTYAGKPGVSGVSNQSKTLNKLLDIIDGARLFSIMIALVVLIASILLIANTIQVAAAQRKNETSIMRLVGASRFMTELPFIIETMVAVVIGGFIALGLLAMGKQFVLGNIFGHQVQSGVIPNLSTNDMLVAGGFGLISGIVLAALTAFITLRAYVRL